MPRSPALTALLLLSLPLSLLLLTACANLPPPPPPSAAADPGLHADDRFAGGDGATTLTQEVDRYWWRRFDDPLMNEWVERALEGNLEVAAAFERVAQARALLEEARGARRLSIGGRAQAGVSRRTGNAGSSPTASGLAASAGLSIEWDPDLWGELLQAERSAASSALRSAHLAQAARLATAATAARAYIELREAQHESAALAETLKVREDSTQLTRARADAGLAPALDLNRAEADLAAARAERDATSARVRQAALALHVLAGQRADATALEPPPVREIPDLEDPLPLPRPLDLLRLRPDVLAAEQALVAAYANVGVARAALYPRLRLPGELILSAAGLGTGSIVSAVAGSLAAVLETTLSDGGRRSARVNAATARAREAALVYQQTVLEALEQVESALIARDALAAQLAARRVAANTSERALEQAQAMYRAGLTGFGDVLDAQRSLLANRVQLIRAEAAQARAAVALFEAVGVIADG